ncbi:hypothetical protein BDV95DRAFT_122041 [Massariosphaeria phaeospora]|uniref:Uncharacterized protein n=1 Tax=Massariosphaeria phaeospora TaxID=100035 RepID=A0A7C8I5M7_9PLEO|nr:hypothetical protein BDV95DRAFT_122041 [Massariosphaeria phaeospora]
MEKQKRSSICGLVRPYVKTFLMGLAPSRPCRSRALKRSTIRQSGSLPIRDMTSSTRNTAIHGFPHGPKYAPVVKLVQFDRGIFVRKIMACRNQVHSSPTRFASVDTAEPFAGLETNDADDLALGCGVIRWQLNGLAMRIVGEGETRDTYLDGPNQRKDYSSHPLPVSLGTMLLMLDVKFGWWHVSAADPETETPGRQIVEACDVLHPEPSKATATPPRW